MIEGAGAHVNEDFIMSEMRFRYVGVVQNTGVTVLMEKNSFHERPPQKKTHNCESADVSLHDMLELPAQAVQRRTLRLSCDAVQPGAVPDYLTSGRDGT